MLNLEKLKQDILDEFHSRLTYIVQQLNTETPLRSGNIRAKAVNTVTNQIRKEWIDQIRYYPPEDRTNASLVLEYCFSVASIEYRNSVWPYEYMAFSRRVGELWEGFCSAAWDFPVRSALSRVQHPDFSDVRNTIRARLQQNIGTHSRQTEIQDDIEILFDIIGDINMREDEVFELEGIPHVIDFKSGFGSNEKGNMLRLRTVGKAYKLWDPATRLMLIVRQSANNNYLRVLKDEGLWEVHTGDDAYELISQLTGADMQWIRDNIIDWHNDLSRHCRSHLSGLLSYLDW